MSTLLGNSRNVMGLAVLVAVLTGWFIALVPKEDLPVNDEWCYVYLAQRFQSRHALELAGCSTVIPVGLYMASAPIVAGFGESYVSLRGVILLFAIATLLFMYALARRLGLGAASSLFVTAALLFSPLALPNIVLYMTDVPALAFLLGGTLFFARGVMNGFRTRDFIVALLLYSAGVLTRQLVVIYAALSFLALPWIAYRPWRRAYGAVAGFLLICAVFEGLSMWSQARPDHVAGASDILVSLHGVRQLGGFATALAQTAVTLLVYLLPATLAAVSGLAAHSWKSRPPPVYVWLGLLPFFGYLAIYGGPFPRLGNMVTEFGFLYPSFMGLGSTPQVLSSTLRWILTALALCAAAIWFAFLLPGIPAGLRTFLRRGNDNEVSECAGRVFAVQVLASLLFVAVTCSRYLWYLGDRYFLLPLPFLLLLVVRTAPPPSRAGLAASGVVVAAFAVFSSLGFDDYNRGLAARREVTRELLAVPYARNEILSGWELDHEWELTRAGSMDYDHRAPAPIHRGYSRKYFRIITPRVGVILGEAPSSSLVPPVCYSSRLAGRAVCAYALLLSDPSLRSP